MGVDIPLIVLAATAGYCDLILVQRLLSLYHNITMFYRTALLVLLDSLVVIRQIHLKHAPQEITHLGTFQIAFNVHLNKAVWILLKHQKIAIVDIIHHW